MTMHASTFQRALIGFLLLAGIGVTWRLLADDDNVLPQPQAVAQSEMNKLLSDLVRERRVCMEATMAAYQTRQATLREYVHTIQDLRDTQLQTTNKANDRIAILKEMLDNVRREEVRVTKLYEGGERGGEAEKYHYVRGERLQAEIALKQEEMRAAQRQ
jgi:hypothetical protein